MRSLLLLASIAFIACDPDISTESLSQVEAGQLSDMRVTQANDSLDFTGNNSTFSIDVFGDGTQQIEMVFIPFNEITCEDPKILLISNDVEFDYLMQEYYPAKDTIVTTPQWDASQGMYTAQVMTAWSCVDTINGSLKIYETPTVLHGHISDLGSNWTPLSNGTANLLLDRGSLPPRSVTLQDTIYRIYESTHINCGLNYRSLDKLYFMFKATRDNQDYIGWIRVNKSDRNVDYAYIDAWAISEDPIQN